MQKTVEKLRADLMATNSALLAVLTSMHPEQQQQALKAFAELSVMKEQHAEKLQDPAQRAAMQKVKEAEERLYQAMQGAHKMRMSKLESGEG